MDSKAATVGMLVTVRGPYVMSDGRYGAGGRYGVDAWTSRTMRVFGVCGDDLELGEPNEDEYSVAIHAGRCTPVGEG